MIRYDEHMNMKCSLSLLADVTAYTDSIV